MRTVLPGAALLAVLLSAGCGVQPTDPIGGSQATGALVYLVRDDTVVPVLRATKNPTNVEQALNLLAEGPNGPEQAQGLTTAIPPTALPVELDGTTITVNTDVTALSPVAVAQLVCTAALSGPATLDGGGRRLGPLTCPV